MLVAMTAGADGPRPSGPAGRLVAVAWLTHPGTLLATAALLINDHVLKQAFPGMVTGKLSDLVGLVMAPPLVAAMLAGAIRRVSPRVLAVTGVLTIGVGFTVTKASQWGAEHVSALFSLVRGDSIILADPTDLLALPALGLAWLTWRRALARPATQRRLQLLATVVLVPVAGLAVAGTSAPRYPEAVSVGTWRGALVLGSTWDGSGRATVFSISRDGGRTFAVPPEVNGRTAPDAAPAPGELADEAVDCSVREPGRCFRIVPGRLAVEETRAHQWRTAWEVSGAAYIRLQQRYKHLGDPRRSLSSRALVVHDRPDGATVVLVANGRDGFLRRNGDGRWERIEFTDGRPAKRLPAAFLLTTAAPVAAAFALMVGAGTALLGARTARRRGSNLAGPRRNRAGGAHPCTAGGQLGREARQAAATAWIGVGLHTGVVILSGQQAILGPDEPSRVLLALWAASVGVFAALIVQALMSLRQSHTLGTGPVVSVLAFAWAGATGALIPYGGPLILGWPDGLDHAEKLWIALGSAAASLAGAYTVARTFARPGLPGASRDSVGRPAGRRGTRSRDDSHR